MEAVLELLSAACAALAAGLLASLRGISGTRPKRVRAKGGPRLSARFLALSETLGHSRAGLALYGAPAAARFVGRLRDLARAHGKVVTGQGALAAFVLAALASCLACTVVSSSVLGAVVGLAACAGLTTAALGSQARKGRDALAAQMPDALRSLSGALGAGKSLAQAIEHVGRTLPEPMGPQFLQASFEVKAGLSVEEAVAGLCERIEAPGIALLGTALQISQRTGSSLNDLFAQTAQMASDSVALRRELEVKTSQVRLSAKVVAAMPVVLCAVLTLLSGDYRAGLALQAGKTCLLVAALLDIAALLLVRRVMAGSLR